ncbi:MAG TPA: SulP family inorganic anion transporter [Vicinamibacterales bacterium]|nr:SulP family inorganic anion transporter [Vicinamibacterales bacterium]
MSTARRPAAGRPKLVAALRGYTRRTAVADLTAGVTVGLVALPLAMAFAISSGLTPQAGLYTAIVAGAIISIFGGSRVQIGGPTGAFVVIVAGIVARHGVDGLFLCTLMAGGLLVVLGATGMGSAVRFIPRPVVVGFTNGIAVLIASTQIRDFFGLQAGTVPGDFLPRLEVLAAQFHTWSPTATTLAVGALAVVIVANRVSTRAPGMILALVGGTLAVAVFHLPVETIGTRFGGIPAGLPKLQLPTVRLELLGGLIVPAMTVAMLGAIESLMSAMVADRMSGDRHDSNVELIAQGLANLASPLVGGLPATGAIARTATNIRSGAKTPIAGIVHALTLLIILLVAAPLARHVPLAVLAAILLVVAYNMGDWAEIPELLRLTRTDIAVWIVTFGLTVFADLTVAVGVGMVCAALLFIKRVADTTTVTVVTDEYVREGHVHVLQGKTIPPYVRIFRIHGPFLFGATDKLRPVYDQIPDLPQVVILRLRNMTALDATGLRAFEDLAQALQRSGRHLVICGARHQPASLIARADFHRHIGDANICAHVTDALQRARDIHNTPHGEPGSPAA